MRASPIGALISMMLLSGSLSHLPKNVYVISLLSLVFMILTFVPNPTLPSKTSVILIILTELSSLASLSYSLSKKTLWSFAYWYSLFSLRSPSSLAVLISWRVWGIWFSLMSISSACFLSKLFFVHIKPLCTEISTGFSSSSCFSLKSKEGKRERIWALKVSLSSEESPWFHTRWGAIILSSGSFALEIKDLSLLRSIRSVLRDFICLSSIPTPLETEERALSSVKTNSSSLIFAFFKSSALMPDSTKAPKAIPFSL